MARLQGVLIYVGVCHDKKIPVMPVMTLTRLVTPDLTAGELG